MSRSISLREKRSSGDKNAGNSIIAGMSILVIGATVVSGSLLSTYCGQAKAFAIFATILPVWMIGGFVLGAGLRLIVAGTAVLIATISSSVGLYPAAALCTCLSVLCLFAQVTVSER